jgi:two-component system OmpR family response regulator
VPILGPTVGILPWQRRCTIEAEVSDTEATATQGKGILVVEDDPSLRLLYRINLELEDYRVREAATIEEAREAVAAERPALVFLDVRLGESPSDMLLDELRDAGIPVVVVSGTVDVEHYESRASAVLGKPFEPESLVAAARALAVG